MCCISKKDKTMSPRSARVKIAIPDKNIVHPRFGELYYGELFRYPNSNPNTAYLVVFDKSRSEEPRRALKLDTGELFSIPAGHTVERLPLGTQITYLVEA